MRRPVLRIPPARAVAATALLVGGLVAAVFRDEDGFPSALGATYVGVVLGFLVALYVDRLQRAEDEASRENEEAKRKTQERQSQDDRERQRRVAVLTLLRQELGRVPEKMHRRQGRSHAPSPLDRLGDILWRSVSASGQLRWITDLQLLGVIASAYELVAVEIELEDRWRQAMGDWGIAGRDTAASHIKNDLTPLDSSLWRLGCEACKAIDVALQADGLDPGPAIICP